jgi:hypothetical protein
MAAKKQTTEKPSTTIVEVTAEDLRRIRIRRATGGFRNNREVVARALDALDRAEKVGKRAAA